MAEYLEVYQEANLSEIRKDSGGSNFFSSDGLPKKQYKNLIKTDETGTHIPYFLGKPLVSSLIMRGDKGSYRHFVLEFEYDREYTDIIGSARLILCCKRVVGFEESHLAKIYVYLIKDKNVINYNEISPTWNCRSVKKYGQCSLQWLGGPYGSLVIGKDLETNPVIEDLPSLTRKQFHVVNVLKLVKLAAHLRHSKLRLLVRMLNSPKGGIVEWYGIDWRENESPYNGRPMIVMSEE